MARVVEHYTSRGETVGGIQGNDGDAELLFHVLECGSSLAARFAVLSNCPLVYHGLVRGPMRITPLGGGIWSVSIKYGKLQNKIQITLDGMCEKIKKMHSIRTIANVRVRYTGGVMAAAPNFKGLIGVSKDKIEGVEVYDPGTFKLSLQWSSKFLNIRPDYIYTVLANGATVNETPVIFNYHGQTLYFDRGSLLFIGGVFHETSDDGCDISMKFEGRLTDATITVGDLDGGLVGLFVCQATEDSTVLTDIASTENLRAGMGVSGVGIPPGAVIFSVNSATSISLDMEATITGETGIIVNNGFLTPAKEGHWYVWIRTRKVLDPVLRVEVDSPDSAHIEQVYEYSDFGLLEVFDVVNSQVDDLDDALTDQLADEQAEVDWI